jgi:periplasmic protein CpxP/Spy
MKVMHARRAAPMLIAAMLIAPPVWAQTAGGPGNRGETAPSGTAEAMPNTNRSTSARQPGEMAQNLIERRIADLHGRLHITPEQTQQWDRFAEVTRENARAMAETYRERAEKVGTMSAVDNLRSYAQIEQQRAEGMQKLVPVFATLYEALSDQQKKTADEAFRSYSGNPQAHHQAAVRQ